MSLRRHLGVIVFGAIAAVIALVAVIFLFKGKAEYADINKKLKVSSRKLDDLLKRDPFPSKGNVQVTKTNYDTAQKYLDTLLGQLSRGQVSPKAMDPAEFQLTLERAFAELMAVATRQNVMVGDEIAYGFERFSTGQLPSENEVPRLIVQLQHISHLVTLLMESGVTSIDEIEREKFDLHSQADDVEPTEDFRGRRSRATRSRSSRRRVESEMQGKREEGLFASERYALTFVSRERALWHVLSKLSQGQPFITVSSVETAQAVLPTSTGVSRGASDRVAAAPSLLSDPSYNPGAVSLSPQQRAARAQAMQRANVRTAARVVEPDDVELPGQPGYIRVRIEVDVFNFDVPTAEGGAS